MEDPISLGARVRQLAALQPDRPAVTDKDRSVTWAQFDARTNALARGLLAAGVKYGDLVTIGLANSVDFIEACWGLWKMGATPQPISHRLPQAEADAVRQLYWAQQAMEGQASRRPSGRILYYVWEDLGAARDGRRLAPEEIGVPVYVPYPVTSPNNER